MRRSAAPTAVANELINRYIWLVDTIRRHGRLSRRELDDLWSRSPFGEGKRGIPRRTFFNYRRAIDEIFHIQIECDTSTYEYYIEENEDADINEWMLNSLATNDALQSSRQVAGRILLENVPSAREFLAPIIEALRENHVICFSYLPYTRINPTRGVLVEPYFLRIYHQVWYVTGRCINDGKVKTYALDRMSQLIITSDTFTPPADCDPSLYFYHAFGITVDRSMPRHIRLRVDPRQAKYFRALPLHHTQREEEVCDQYSIFTYNMLLTPDLVNELLSFGPRVTVLEPPELRTMVQTDLAAALKNYR